MSANIGYPNILRRSYIVETCSQMGPTVTTDNNEASSWSEFMNTADNRTGLAQ